MAIDLLLKAAATNEKILGKDHIQNVACYRSLALLYSFLQEFEISKSYELKNLNILKNTYGQDDIRTLDSLYYLKQFHTALQQQEANLQAKKQQQSMIANLIAKKKSAQSKTEPPKISIPNTIPVTAASVAANGKSQIASKGNLSMEAIMDYIDSDKDKDKNKKKKKKKTGPNSKKKTETTEASVVPSSSSTSSPKKDFPDTTHQNNNIEKVELSAESKINTTVSNSADIETLSNGHHVEVDTTDLNSDENQTKFKVVTRKRSQKYNFASVDD